MQIGLKNGMTRFHFRPWMVPLSLAVVVATVGFWAQLTLEGTLNGRLAEELRVILNADVAALQLWLDTQESVAEAAAIAPPVPSLIAQMSTLSRDPNVTTDALRRLPAQAELAEALAPVQASQRYEGFLVIDRRGIVLASASNDLIEKPSGLGRDEVGKSTPLFSNALAAKVLKGQTVIVPPLRALSSTGDTQTPFQPTMFVVTPVKTSSGEVIAALAFRLRPQDTFTHILNVARFGQSGETYAFNGNGVMISDSRFVDQLSAIGILPDGSGSQSALYVTIRNPNGNLLEGFRPTVPVDAWPLTRMAADAIAGNGGVDVEGYRDYRGVYVVGAWTWLPRYGLGVATEVDSDEAFRTRTAIRRAFWTVLGLLILSAAGTFVYSRAIARLQRRVRKAQKLGQYTLERKIGQGGMGTVYEARHAMLRRPTAIKLIRSDQTSEEMIRRFEREVQLASQLTNPNTIAIYDYGRTPEGVFYYAMEYLSGLTLDSLVAGDGPQPERRVIHMLRQVLRSLAEAHSIGLIHRDIKPANIMLCARGGMYDVVKVLDFGLAKELSGTAEARITAVNEVLGTPYFMAPEMITSPAKVDARTDLYAVGGVAYYLVSGNNVFEGGTMADVLTSHLSKIPTPPSERLGRKLNSRLEELILSCLAKNQADRPANAREVLLALEGQVIPDLGEWTDQEARLWWSSKLATVEMQALSRQASLGSIEPTVEINLSGRLSGYSR